eukprot:256515_1
MSSKGNLRNRKQNKRNKQNSPSKKKNNKSDNKKNAKPVRPSNGWPTSFITLSALVMIAYNELQFNIPSINSKISSNKPYQTIESFYPYYLEEHKDPNSQKMHILGSTLLVLIALIKPEVAITGFIAVLSGYITFPAFRGLDDGVMEALVVLFMVAFISHLNGIKKYAVLCLLISYGCAWFGHFYFEKNTPATFVY